MSQTEPSQARGISLRTANLAMAETEPLAIVEAGCLKTMGWLLGLGLQLRGLSLEPRGLRAIRQQAAARGMLEKMAATEVLPIACDLRCVEQHCEVSATS